MRTSKLLEAAKIPCDVYENTTRLTINGRKEVFLENYKGIQEYTCEKIVVLMNRGRICFCGANFHIEYYSNHCMKIVGLVQTIQYL